MFFNYLTILVYNARGQSIEAQKSRIHCGACKNGVIDFSERLVATILKKSNKQNYFDNAVLVPMPRSTPLVEGAVYPTKVIAETFVRKGLGNTVIDCLVRKFAIPKSSSASTASSRTKLSDIIDSLVVRSHAFEEENLVIIDDVLTLGRNSMAAALKLSDAYPDKNIKIFAAFRTRGVDQSTLVEIQKGEMRLNRSQTDVILPD